MGKLYRNIIEMVGDTPILQLQKIEEKFDTKAHIFAKLECFNPGGSVKDRIALKMIDAAEREGKITKGGTLSESTSGNTGIGIAAIGAAKGYRVIITMPENMSKERVSILKGYGAEVILTPAADYMEGSNRKAKELAETIENSFLVGQGSNPNNPAMHIKTTGPEIWETMEGKVDVFLAGVGTGGTITGTGTYLKGRNPSIQIIVAEPDASPVLSGGEPGVHHIQGVGPVVPCEVLDRSIYGEIIRVKDQEAIDMARLCAKLEGWSIGISAGMILHAAIKVAKRPENTDKNIVIVFPDKGERYLSSGIYE